MQIRVISDGCERTKRRERGRNAEEEPGKIGFPAAVAVAVCVAVAVAVAIRRGESGGGFGIEKAHALERDVARSHQG